MNLEELNELGVTLTKAGRFAEAESVFRQAAELDPSSHKPHANLALVHRAQGRHDEEAAALALAVERAPDNPRLLGRLARSRLEHGQLQLAVDAARRAVAIDGSPAHKNLAARALLALSRPDEALAVLGDARDAEGLWSSIAALLSLHEGARAEALIDAYAQQEPAIEPLVELALIALEHTATAAGGKLLALLQNRPANAGEAARLALAGAEFSEQSGRLDEARAKLSAIDWAVLEPTTLGRLIEALRRSGASERANEVLARGMKAWPSSVELMLATGDEAAKAGDCDESLVWFSRAHDLAPDNSQVQLFLGGAYHHIGDGPRAMQAIESVCQREPMDLRAQMNAIFCALYSGLWSPAKTRARIQAVAERFYVAPRTVAQPGRSWDPERPLQIGYVSQDFHEHAVMRFARGVLREHDRSLFELTCYAAVEKPDAITESIRALPLRWRDVSGLSNQAIAQQIAADGIDVLIDLTGHTGPIVSAFAFRPAPLQLTWLGFPATTGMSAMDLRVSDALADPPPAAEELHSERLLRLPHAAWSYEAFRALEVRPRPQGAPIVFGSANRPTKLTDAVLLAWGRILAAVPGAELTITGLGIDSRQVQRRLIAGVTHGGADPERVRFRGWVIDHEQHLADWHGIDICLDSYPYVGTTTTCEALLMGVPVVSLAGASHVSRVGASLLAEVGLADLVAREWDEYVARAVALANDAPRRIQLREALRERFLRLTLGDARRFTRSFETELRASWRAHVSSPAAGLEQSLRRVPAARTADPQASAPALFVSPSITKRSTFIAIEQGTELDDEAALAVHLMRAGDAATLVDPDSLGHVLALLDAVGPGGSISVASDDATLLEELRACARLRLTPNLTIAAGGAQQTSHAAGALLELPARAIGRWIDQQSAEGLERALVRVTATDGQLAAVASRAAAAGLRLFRAVPLLGMLVPHPSPAAIDPLSRSLFVLGDQAARTLGQRGLLADGPPRSEPALDQQPRWPATPRYLESLGLASASLPSTVRRFLAACAPDRPVIDRVRDLEIAFQATAEHIAQDEVGGRLTLARIAAASGRRSLVTPGLEPLLAAAAIGSPRMPFLTATASREGDHPAPADLAGWVRRQAIEAVVAFGARSSFDATSEHRRLLTRYLCEGGDDPDMNRRLGLIFALGRGERVKPG